MLECLCQHKVDTVSDLAFDWLSANFKYCHLLNFYFVALVNLFLHKVWDFNILVLLFLLQRE